MNNARNITVYRLWSPVYDMIFGPLFRRARRSAVEALALKAGERLLIPGIGTGLDLPYLPPGIDVMGIDISEAMLAKARRKSNGSGVTLRVMDAGKLDFPDASFDALLFNLILSVVPDGRNAFAEAWRVLRPGGRFVVFDKFLPDDAVLTGRRERLGRMISKLGTDPNRRFDEIIAEVPGLIIEQDQPSLFSGQYRIIKGSKAS